MKVTLAGPADIARLDAALRSSRLVAVDTEFHAERRYTPHLCLVQLQADDGDVWLVDPLAGTVLSELAPALRAIPWLLHGGAQDLRILAAALGGLPERVWDTQIAAGLVSEVFPASYVALAREHLGVELDKSATLTDWSRRPLSPAQLRYAAEDVRLLRPLWDRLWERIGAVERAAICAGACDDARRDALDPDPPTIAWRQVTGASALTPRQASVLQELAAWREEVAREEDQPTRALLADAVLTDVARRLPMSVEALADNRRVPKGIVKRHGQAIVECVRRGLRRPESAWPTPVAEGSDPDRTATWLLALAQADGRRQGYAARLALPRILREDLASERPSDRSTLGARLGPWRDALIGDPLWSGLCGDATLRLGPAGPVIERRAPPPEQPTGEGKKNSSGQ